MGESTHTTKHISMNNYLTRTVIVDNLPSFGIFEDEDIHDAIKHHIDDDRFVLSIEFITEDGNLIDHDTLWCEFGFIWVTTVPRCLDDIVLCDDWEQKTTKITHDANGRHVEYLDPLSYQSHPITLFTVRENATEVDVRIDGEDTRVKTHSNGLGRSLNVYKAIGNQVAAWRDQVIVSVYATGTTTSEDEEEEPTPVYNPQTCLWITTRAAGSPEFVVKTMHICHNTPEYNMPWCSLACDSENEFYKVCICHDGNSHILYSQLPAGEGAVRVDLQQL